MLYSPALNLIIRPRKFIIGPLTPGCVIFGFFENGKSRRRETPKTQADKIIFKNLIFLIIFAKREKKNKGNIDQKAL